MVAATARENGGYAWVWFLGLKKTNERSEFMQILFLPCVFEFCFYVFRARTRGDATEALMLYGFKGC
jgi:hypothetical protein